jgi:hypothetical protein
VHDAASNSSINIGSVETITSEHLHQFEYGGKHVRYLTLRVKAVQLGISSQGITTTQKIQDSCQLPRSWQVCFGIHQE